MIRLCLVLYQPLDHTPHAINLITHSSPTLNDTYSTCIYQHAYFFKSKVYMYIQEHIIGSAVKRGRSGNRPRINWLTSRDSELLDLLLKIDPFAGVYRTFATTRRARSDCGSMLFSPSSTPDTPKRSPRLLARQQIRREKSTTTYCSTIKHSASGGTGSHDTFEGVTHLLSWRSRCLLDRRSRRPPCPPRWTTSLAYPSP